jgi:glyoxylase-like metal-dependent hydrolase (beta-lactamase superfamily II)
LRLHWGTPQVILEHHPGPAPGAIWAVIPQARVAFIGDAVPLNQPPFLSNADLPAWIELLDLLQGPEYRTYVLISGRGGPVTAEDVRLLRKLLVDIEQQFTGLWAQNAPVEEIEALAPRMLSEFKIPAARRELYEQRLRYGLQRYYNRHYRPPEEFGEEPAE